jgi:Protein of unknown function (DUF4232)
MKRLLIALCALAIVPLEQAHAVSVHACLGPDLAARADFQGASGAQEGGVVLRNRTHRSCKLNGRAVIDFAAQDMPAPLPVRVAIGRGTDGHLPDRALVLSPGQRAFVHARWSNWCGDANSEVRVRLWLRSLEPRVHVRGEISTPRCDNRGLPSRVAIGPYERVRRYP